ncbi:MAG TPA: helix-turn-helix domain-containing protein [Solirubrobacteraceae bacterium]|jgi:AcrR family transcriptional regulator|nr:helix-turn-helix domain-containing protein [Solirubrobacteraceae bacterium]
MTADRPLRADAERNRRRVMDAARELFAQRGLEVTLNDIARHAGVGVGTVYRRFPDKDALIEALFEERVAEIVAIARGGLEASDPWEGFTGAITSILALQESDRALKELMLSSEERRERVNRIRALMAPIVAQLITRARDAGQLRADVVPQDFPLLQIMLGAVIDVEHDHAPGLWRRYLEMMLQGMRATPAAPAPLSVDAPDWESMSLVLASWRPPRRH